MNVEITAMLYCMCKEMKQNKVKLTEPNILANTTNLHEIDINRHEIDMNLNEIDRNKETKKIEHDGTSISEASNTQINVFQWKTNKN